MKRSMILAGVPIAMVGSKGEGAHAEKEAVSVSSLDEMKACLVEFLQQAALPK
jgi:di/tripeptidase